MLRRLENFLFYLFIFTLPFQTRVILYQFRPVFNEWTSVYLYLTDILLLAVFLLWFWRNKTRRFLRNFHFQWGQWLKNYSFWLLIFLLISFVSLSSAGNLRLGFYYWFKLLEMAILFFYLKNRLYISQSEDEFLDYETAQKTIDFRHLSYIFIFSGLFQSYLAIRQYVAQASLGLKCLGESPLSAEINGVAKFSVDGLNFIRPYGSLPHPNVLAAFLFAAIFFLYYLWFTKGHSPFKKYLLLSFYFILLFALFLTFSRGVVAVFLTVNLIFFSFNFFQGWRSKNRPLMRRTFFIFFLLLVFCFLIFTLARPEVLARFKISAAEQAVSMRKMYNETALITIADYPLLGIGAGGFVWEFQNIYHLMAGWIHQPVHNLYLLTASEIGLPGLAVFLFFLYLLLKKKPRLIVFGLLLVGFLFIGLFDHFFLTLQQGQLLLWLVLGILAAYGGASEISNY